MNVTVFDFAISRSRGIQSKAGELYLLKTFHRALFSDFQLILLKRG